MKKAAKATPNQHLRRERELHCLSQGELARHIGTTSLNVSRWERGITFPNSHFRQELCRYFQKRVSDLGFLEEETTESAEALSPIWNVPYRRNPFFTGREDILKRLHHSLQAGKMAALIQLQAISGLGGIGKTQTAIEYAYRYARAYQAVLWAPADTREILASVFVSIGDLLQLRPKEEQDHGRVITAVKHWLRDHRNWLLILDNADDLGITKEFLPETGQGHLLLTTRAQVTGVVAQHIEIEKMQIQESALFLLRRAKIITPDAPFESASADECARALDIARTMDNLPLALDQAGAYIEETECGLSGYLDRYRKQGTYLLNMRGGTGSDHPEPVATTWSLSFEKVEQANPLSAELLRLCAFLHPDAIPEEIITEGAAELGPTLQTIAGNPFALDEAIKALRSFSLLRRNSRNRMLSMHQLVQVVLKDRMEQATQRQWAERTVRVVNAAFPDTAYETWKRCQRYLPHAKVCAEHIEHWDMCFPEAARLLNQAGYYLYQHGLYTLVEPLFQRALAIREQALGPEHPDISQTLNALALLCYAQGKYDQAEPLFQRALAIREQALGPEHPDTAESLNDLAALYCARGQYEQATPLSQRALAICEQSLGPEHPTTASCLHTLAWLYRVQGQYEQATPLSQHALAICEQVLGPEHPTTASSLNNLALLLYDQGKYKEAEPLFQRALAIREKVLEHVHPDVAKCLESYAELLRKTNRASEATELESSAMTIHQSLAQMDDTMQGIE